MEKKLGIAFFRLFLAIIEFCLVAAVIAISFTDYSLEYCNFFKFTLLYTTVTFFIRVSLLMKKNNHMIKNDMIKKEIYDFAEHFLIIYMFFVSYIDKWDKYIFVVIPILIFLIIRKIYDLITKKTKIKS